MKVLGSGQKANGRQAFYFLSSLAAGAGRGLLGTGSGGFTAREAGTAPARGQKQHLLLAAQLQTWS